MATWYNTIHSRRDPCSRYFLIRVVFTISEEVPCSALKLRMPEPAAIHYLLLLLLFFFIKKEANFYLCKCTKFLTESQPPRKYIKFSVPMSMIWILFFRHKHTKQMTLSTDLIRFSFYFGSYLSYWNPQNGENGEYRPKLFLNYENFNNQIL